MDDLVYRLRKRAEIRRQIPDRKSVQEGKPDRIADLLEEAADYIEKREVFSDVQRFMQAAGQSVDKYNDEQATLYHRLINEEYSEFISARIVKDEVETIDACFDMIWVIVGYMLSKGWDCEKIWDEGSASNLAKIDSVTGKVLKRDDGKVLKPEGWQPPDFTKFVTSEKING